MYDDNNNYEENLWWLKAIVIVVPTLFIILIMGPAGFKYIADIIKNAILILMYLPVLTFLIIIYSIVGFTIYSIIKFIRKFFRKK